MEVRRLRRLAALYRVQTSYIDMHGHRRYASPEALLATLAQLGASVSDMGDVPDALRQRREQLISEWVPPVLVAWDGDASFVGVRVPLSLLPTHALGQRLQYTLHLENGDIWSGNLPISQARTLRQVNCGGMVMEVKAFMRPRTLPFGYHKLTVLLGDRAFHATVISAPRRCHQIDGQTGRDWGIFAPIYALDSQRSWGVGDFAAAEALISWGAEMGATLFGTLPFLASYLDTPCDPSPYTPVSRFFWNELLIDVARIPELSVCALAQELVGSADFQADLRALRANRLIDYRAAMRLKQRVLRALSEFVRNSHGARYDMVRAYAESHPLLSEYACFRAVTSRRGEVWTNWPAELQESIEDGPRDSDEEFYHMYVQCVAGEQIEGMIKRCEAEHVTLYLDYPLGTHPQGFDTWKYRSLFARDATVGAPPDPVFTTGQDWGFHPLLPAMQRRDGYRYMAAGIRHQMRHAGMLRLDHVMGLHRLYWIPQGFHKSEGVYVHCPSEEIHAVVTLESQRSQTAVVGENLGIVPGYVTSAMDRHGLVGMNVAYWEIAADPDGALQRMAGRPNAVASLNTHDMFPFAAFWNGIDADRRCELGMITPEQADLERWLRGELRGRLTQYLRTRGFEIQGEEDTAGALRAILTLLAHSQARWVLVNLEDLWLEVSPQNIPDTVDEHPNWRQKTQLTVEEFIRDDSIRAILGILRRVRNEARG